MSRSTSTALLRRSVPAMTLVAVAAAVGLTGAPPAAAVSQTYVKCNTNPSALGLAIAAAAPGATLSVTGTCTGPFTIAQDLTLIGVGKAVLDGNHAGSTVTITPGAHVRLDNLVITNGNASVGGGIYNAGSALTVDNSVVHNNNSASVGGGIATYGTGVTLTLNSSTVDDNTAAMEGGGIYNPLGDTAVLHLSNVSKNAASDSGGGIYNIGSLSLASSIVMGNTSGHNGGGIDNEAGTAALTLSAVTGNKAATTGSGGGIYQAMGATTTLDLTVVAANIPNNCTPAIGLCM